MGIYINPKTTSKEVWLQEHAIAGVPNYSTIFPVVLVDNGAFTAAAVCDTKEEFIRFMKDDGRAKLVLAVSYQSLSQVLEPSEMKVLSDGK